MIKPRTPASPRGGCLTPTSSAERRGNGSMPLVRMARQLRERRPVLRLTLGRVVPALLHRPRQLCAVHPNHEDALNPGHSPIQVVQPLFDAVYARLQASDSLETQPCNREVQRRKKDPERYERNPVPFLFTLPPAVSRPSNPWGFIGLSCVKVSVSHRAEAWGLTTHSTILSRVRRAAGPTGRPVREGGSSPDPHPSRRGPRWGE